MNYTCVHGNINGVPACPPDNRCDISEKVVKREIRKFFECLLVECPENSEQDSDGYRRAYLEHYLKNL
tara:strand:+ start:704 stop:907 length:204 start_codon:yes stop_codon:yes gene_type:complete